MIIHCKSRAISFILLIITMYTLQIRGQGLDKLGCLYNISGDGKGYISRKSILQETPKHTELTSYFNRLDIVVKDNMHEDLYEYSNTLDRPVIKSFKKGRYNISVEVIKPLITISLERYSKPSIKPEIKELFHKNSQALISDEAVFKYFSSFREEDSNYIPTHYINRVRLGRKKVINISAETEKDFIEIKNSLSKVIDEKELEKLLAEERVKITAREYYGTTSFKELAENDGSEMSILDVNLETDLKPIWNLVKTSEQRKSLINYFKKSIRSKIALDYRWGNIRKYDQKYLKSNKEFALQAGLSDLKENEYSAAQTMAIWNPSISSPPPGYHLIISPKNDLSQKFLLRKPVEFRLKWHVDTFFSHSKERSCWTPVSDHEDYKSLGDIILVGEKAHDSIRDLNDDHFPKVIDAYQMHQINRDFKNIACIHKDILKKANYSEAITWPDHYHKQEFYSNSSHAFYVQSTPERWTLKSLEKTIHNARQDHISLDRLPIITVNHKDEKDEKHQTNETVNKLLRKDLDYKNSIDINFLVDTWLKATRDERDKNSKHLKYTIEHNTETINLTNDNFIPAGEFETTETIYAHHINEKTREEIGHFDNIKLTLNSPEGLNEPLNINIKSLDRNTDKSQKINLKYHYKNHKEAEKSRNFRIEKINIFRFDNTGEQAKLGSKNRLLAYNVKKVVTKYRFKFKNTLNWQIRLNNDHVNYEIPFKEIVNQLKYIGKNKILHKIFHSDFDERRRFLKNFGKLETEKDGTTYFYVFGEIEHHNYIKGTEATQQLNLTNTEKDKYIEIIQSHLKANAHDYFAENETFDYYREYFPLLYSLDNSKELEEDYIGYQVMQIIEEQPKQNIIIHGGLGSGKTVACLKIHKKLNNSNYPWVFKIDAKELGYGDFNKNDFLFEKFIEGSEKVSELEILGRSTNLQKSVFNEIIKEAASRANIFYIIDGVNSNINAPNVEILLNKISEEGSSVILSTSKNEIPYFNSYNNYPQRFIQLKGLSEKSILLHAYTEKLQKTIASPEYLGLKQLYSNPLYATIIQKMEFSKDNKKIDLYKKLLVESLQRYHKTYNRDNLTVDILSYYHTPLSAAKYLAYKNLSKTTNFNDILMNFDYNEFQVENMLKDIEGLGIVTYDFKTPTIHLPPRFKFAAFQNYLAAEYLSSNIQRECGEIAIKHDLGRWRESISIKNYILKHKNDEKFKEVWELAGEILKLKKGKSYAYFTEIMAANSKKEESSIAGKVMDLAGSIFDLN